MKIGIVCFNLSWQAGGVRLIYSMAHSLMDQGHQVVIYGPEFNEAVYPDLWNGLTIKIVPPPQPLAWHYENKGLIARIGEKFAQEKAFKTAAAAIAAAMDADFDVVNLHDFAYSMAPLYIKKNPNAKIIWTMNDPPYGHLPKDGILYDVASRLFNAYREISTKRQFNYIDGAVVLVERNRRWAEEHGIPGKVIWSGIDFEQFYAPPKSIQGKAKISLLSVGALVKYRRFEDTIRAVAELRQQGFDVEATIIAKNLYHEDDYRNALIALAGELGIADKIVFLFDGVSDAELKTAYAAADFFVLPVHLPSPRNGFGWQLVIFEAMAAGVPSVVCRTNDVTDALEENKTALFVNAEAPKEIAAAIAACLREPARYDALARDGQNFVKENISWKSYAKAFADFSLSVIRKLRT